MLSSSWISSSFYYWKTNQKTRIQIFLLVLPSTIQSVSQIISWFVFFFQRSYLISLGLLIWNRLILQRNSIIEWRKLFFTSPKIDLHNSRFEFTPETHAFQLLIDFNEIYWFYFRNIRTISCTKKEEEETESRLFLEPMIDYPNINSIFFFVKNRKMIIVFVCLSKKNKRYGPIIYWIRRNYFLIVIDRKKEFSSKK